MKTHRQAFTLLEVIIALGLSCFVVLGMMQAYSNLMQYFNRVQGILASNRQVCLLFNQIERDINTAFIPELYKEIPQEELEKEGAATEGAQQAQPAKQKTPEEKKKEEEADAERLKNYFIGRCDLDNKKRHEGRAVFPFVSLSMINTNAFQVYGQRRVRLVRVLYKLEQDKELYKKGIESFTLVRKETTDIEDVAMKEHDVLALPQYRQHVITSHVVAKGIKKFYLEYAYIKPSDKQTMEASGKDAQPETLIVSAWGDKKETQGVVPMRVDLFIEFWDEEYRQSYPFNSSFVIFSYPTIHEKKEEEEAKVTAEKPTEESSSNVPPADVQGVNVDQGGGVKVGV